MKNSQIVLTEIEKVLTAYLGRTQNTLKSMVLTHPDKDHINLVKRLIIDKGVKVGELYYGGSPYDYGTDIASWIGTNGNGSIARVVVLCQGYFNSAPVASLSYQAPPGRDYNVYGRILAANVGDPRVKSDANPNSVVLLFTYLDINIFLMGDATTQTEDFILAWDNADPNHTVTGLLQNRATVLKAGHHGSNTSSGDAWLQKLAPQVVVISSDTRAFNQVSLPRSGVINRIFARNTVVDLFPQNPAHGQHYYVQYNDIGNIHEIISSRKAMCTTLHLLQFIPPTNQYFIAYGTSWYYTISRTQQGREVYITPACSWDKINQPY
jgi:hypothetical protein